MKQTKEMLEDWYSKPDQWNYFSNEDDAKRKEKILSVLGKTKYKKGLDVGCGEGFIAQSLPCKEIFGYELSDNACLRWDKKIKRVEVVSEKYDLVVSTGTLYNEYEHESIAETIRSSASKHILIAGIKELILPYEFGKLISETEFEYRGFTQIVKLYEVAS